MQLCNYQLLLQLEPTLMLAVVPSCCCCRCPCPPLHPTRITPAYYAVMISVISTTLYFSLLLQRRPPTLRPVFISGPTPSSGPTPACVPEECKLPVGKTILEGHDMPEENGHGAGAKTSQGTLAMQMGNQVDTPISTLLDSRHSL